MPKFTFPLLIALLFLFVFFIFRSPQNNPSPSSSSHIEIRDGIQYITLQALGGYFPQISNAKAGIPTKLIIKTDGTYDCSAALVIRALGYRSMLPPVGEEVIDLGTPAKNSTLSGACSMGMYTFSLRFSE